MVHVAAFKIRTLPTEQKLIKLEEELKCIRWDILELDEVRSKSQNQISLKSGYQFYYRGEEENTQGGVVFLFHKKHAKKII